MQFIDISLEIKPDMVTYPGNPRPQIEQYARIPEDKTSETRITLGTHTGTHVDAVSHVQKEGGGVLDLPLHHFYGPCRVLDLTRAGRAIEAHHLQEFDIQPKEIILLKTENSLHQYDHFRENFAHLTASAADLIAAKKILTLGIDYLSVKKFHADHEVHEKLITNLALIEGLYLKKTPAGKYIFSAFPIKVNTDGAPMRAVLISQTNDKT